MLQCFVGHVFEPQYLDDLRAAIREAFVDYSPVVSLYLADEYFSPGPIFTKICSAIDSSFLCLFEVSESSRPNVFLELGYALAKGKTAVMLVRRGVSVPSDLAGFDRIEYHSMKQLTERLRQLLPRIMASAANSEQLFRGAVALDIATVDAIRSLGQGESIGLDALRDQVMAKGVSKGEFEQTVKFLLNEGACGQDGDRLFVKDHGFFPASSWPRRGAGA